MKKLKLLPLLGAALLVLTSCGEAGETSQEKAYAYYDYSVAEQYNNNLKDISYGPMVVESNDGIHDPATGYTYFKNNYLAWFYDDTASFTPDKCFLKYNDLDATIPIATKFGEEVTYNLEGKRITTHFTGSTTPGDSDSFSFAMYYTLRYNAVGLIEYGTFDLWGSSPEDTNSGIRTLFKVTGKVVLNWVKI